MECGAAGGVVEFDAGRGKEFDEVCGYGCNWICGGVGMIEVREEIRRWCRGRFCAFVFPFDDGGVKCWGDRDGYRA